MCISFPNSLDFYIKWFCITKSTKLTANLGAHCLEGWVQAATRKWDVISFQFGLHDLGFDTERISVEQYTGAHFLRFIPKFPWIYIYIMGFT